MASNKSRTYLLPLIASVIGIEKKYYELIHDTYIFDSENKYINCFFIVQEYCFRNPEYISYENNLINNQYFIKAVDSGTSVIYIYKFPEEYLPEYENFKRGRYSKFLEDSKRQILKFWTTVKGSNSTDIKFVLKVKQVLYKEKLLKKQLEQELAVKLDDDAELSSIIDYDNETINL